MRPSHDASISQIFPRSIHAVSEPSVLDMVLRIHQGSRRDLRDLAVYFYFRVARSGRRSSNHPVVHLRKQSRVSIVALALFLGSFVFTTQIAGPLHELTAHDCVHHGLHEHAHDEVVIAPAHESEPEHSCVLCVLHETSRVALIVAEVPLESATCIRETLYFNSTADTGSRDTGLPTSRAPPRSV